MNANKKPELYVVQTPEMNARIAEYHKNMSEEQKQLFLRQNRIQTPAEREQHQAGVTDSALLLGLQMVMSIVQTVVDKNLSRFKLEQQMITATRFQQLRQAIQRGERFSIGQMQDMTCCYHGNVVQIAELLDMPVDVVKAAVKRWIFF